MRLRAARVKVFSIDFMVVKSKAGHLWQYLPQQNGVGRGKVCGQHDRVLERLEGQEVSHEAADAPQLEQLGVAEARWAQRAAHLRVHPLRR